MTQKYDRFKSAPWFQEGIKPSVLIGGAGGIGSWLTVLLNRAGFETYVYDFDRLEEINMAGQLFAHRLIGMNKVDALAEMTQELCREQIIANLAKVDEKTMTNEVVFAAFDNIKARKDMFTSWLNAYQGNKEAIFIDGRLTAEQLTIFSIKGDDEYGIKEYQEDHLPDDSTIPELQCTLKQTSHGAAMIAAHMVEMFTNWYSVVLKTDESRYTPFFWEYIIPIGYCSQRDANKPDSSSIFVDTTPEQREKIEEVRNLVSLQESKKEAESTLDQVYGFELDSNPFNLLLDDHTNEAMPEMPPFDLKDYYIIDNKPIHKDTPNITQLIAESASVGTIQMMTLQEVKDKFGYMVGVDPYRQDSPTSTDLEQAQASIEAWDAVANGPAPDLSILEEENKPDSPNDPVDPLDFLW